MAYVRNAHNNNSVTCSWVKNWFFLVLWSRLAGTSVESYENWSFFNQVFGQFKEELMLKLHKKRVSHVVVCPIAFILFYDRDWQGGVLKLMENDYFLVFLAV